MKNKKKKRIAIVINRIYDIPNKAVYQRTKYLSDKFDIYILTRYNVPPSISNKVKGVKICPGKAYGLDRIIFLFWVVYNTIRLETSVVYTVFSYNNLILVSGYFCKIIGKTWIADILDDPALGINKRTVGFRYNLGSVWQKFLYEINKQTLKFADAIVILKGMKETVTGFNINESKFIEITNGVNLITDPKKIKEDQACDFNVVYVGLLARNRGISTIIKAVELIKNIDCNIKLIGEFASTEEEVFLTDMVNKYNLNKRITFTGYIPHNEVLELINSASVCLYPFPSLSELEHVSPIKVFEYMAFGKPVIATNLSGVRIIIEDLYNGILIDPEDEQQLANAIRELKEDIDLRKQLGQNAFESVKHYSWENINSEIVCRLNELKLL